MGGSGDIVLAAASENESGVCLSFKHRKNLTACCNHADNMREYLALIIPILTSLVFLCLLAICCFIIFLVIISFTFFVLFVCFSSPLPSTPFPSFFHLDLKSLVEMILNESI